MSETTLELQRSAVPPGGATVVERIEHAAAKKQPIGYDEAIRMGNLAWVGMSYVPSNEAGVGLPWQIAEQLTRLQPLEQFLEENSDEVLLRKMVTSGRIQTGI